MYPRISVALASYNGASFLEGQLASLVCQKCLPFELVVCDDVSNDNTLEILREFKRKSPFPVHIHRNKKNLGYAENFFKAARLCSGDWVAFCDQDDVWLENKLYAAAETIKRNPSSVLVLQNALVSDCELKTNGRVFPNTIGEGYYKSLAGYGVWIWQGFLQTVRIDVLKNIPSDIRPLMDVHRNIMQSHDMWTCMMANILGGITVLGEPVAIYRRHPKTVTNSTESNWGSSLCLISKIKVALKTSFEIYDSAADLSRSKVDYLNKVAAGCDNMIWRNRIQEYANIFEWIQMIHGLRSDLYGSYFFMRRIKYFVEILRHGGYTKTSNFGFGLLSFLKDFFVVFGLVAVKPRLNK